jgi:hypothetical protein
LQVFKTAEMVVITLIIKFIFTKNLGYQILLDSVQSRGISHLLDDCSNPESELFAKTWEFFETLHSYSYTYIIKNVYPNASDVFDTILKDDEILKRIEEIKTSGTLYDLFYNLNKEEFEEAKIYHPEWKFKLDKYNNEAEKYYYDNIDNLSEEIKLKFKEWFILESLVYNMNYLSHISTNEFGFYFVDYCKENGYDGYLAVSSYADPRITGEEIAIVNTKKLHSMEIVTENPY